MIVRIALGIIGLVELFGFSFCLVMMGKFPEEPSWGIGWFVFLILGALTALQYMSFGGLEQAHVQDTDELWEAIHGLTNDVTAIHHELHFHKEDSTAHTMNSQIGTEQEDEDYLLTAENLKDLALVSDPEPTEPDVVAIETMQESTFPTEKIQVVAPE